MEPEFEILLTFSAKTLRQLYQLADGLYGSPADVIRLLVGDEWDRIYNAPKQSGSNADGPIEPGVAGPAES